MSNTPTLPIRATIQRGVAGILEPGDRIDVHSAADGVELVRLHDGLGQVLFSNGLPAEAVIGEIEVDGQRLTLLAVRGIKNRRKIFGLVINEDDDRITTGEWTAEDDGKGDDDSDAATTGY